MDSARHAFRFTIGQGMAVIAALAVAFAYLPMPVAIVLSIVTSLLARRWHACRQSPGPDPARDERIGCLSSCLGFLLGTTVGTILVMSEIGPVEMNGLSVMAIAAGSGLVGAFGGRVIGRMIVRALPVQQIPRADPSQTNRAAIRAEINSISQLLARAEAENDREVANKLKTYQARLLRQLENRSSDLSEPLGGITLDPPSPAESGDQNQ